MEACTQQKVKTHCFVTFNRSSLIKSHKSHCLKGRVGATFKTKDFIKEAKQRMHAMNDVFPILNTDK